MINLLGTETAKCVVRTHKIWIQHSWGPGIISCSFWKGLQSARGGPEGERAVGEVSSHLHICPRQNARQATERLNDAGRLSQDRKDEEKNVSRGA